jgi:hypothetical protein
MAVTESSGGEWHGVAPPSIVAETGQQSFMWPCKMRPLPIRLDFRAEEDIYDVLDKSVSGELLTDIYLETRRGLELANQGGVRAKVKEIDVVGMTARTGDGGGFLAHVTWVVGGSVGHWGHLHQRRNKYQAELDVRPIDGDWKLVGLQVLQEERL